MKSRFKNRRLVRNNLPQYKTMLKERGRNFALMYGSLTSIPLTQEDFASIESVPYRWGHGDKFYKVAAEYYGDTSAWWIIAWFNNTPTENHLELGDLIYIPIFTEELMSMWGV